MREPEQIPGSVRKERMAAESATTASANEDHKQSSEYGRESRTDSEQNSSWDCSQKNTMTKAGPSREGVPCSV